MQVTFIGAGSATFAVNLMSDILMCPDLRENVTFSLMDVNPEALDYARRLAENIAQTLNVKATIRATTDRRRALAGSDFVMVTIRAGGTSALDAMKDIPRKYGLKQTVADTVGVGGIFYGLRHMPILVSIARDVEEICPNAWILNYTNPMAMNTLAMLRATRAKAVGLCHSVQGTTWRLRLYASLARLSPKACHDLLDSNRYSMHWPYNPPAVDKFMKTSPLMIPAAEWRAQVAGINHMSAFLKLEWNGKDAYPLLERASEREEIMRLDPTRFEIFRRLGYFITESSFHLTEYTPYFLQHPAEIRRLAVFRFAPSARRMWTDYLDTTREKLEAGEPVIDVNRKASDEYAYRIIRAIVTGRPDVINGNVHNLGGKVIHNLPPDCCVEVPCLVDHNGITPTVVGDLPPQVAAMIRTNISVQDLAVRGVLEEDRRYIYQAAMMDPNTGATLTLPQIWGLVDELLELLKKDIPRGLARKRAITERRAIIGG